MVAIQQTLLLDRFTIDKCAVRGIQVVQDESAGFRHERRVMGRHRRIVRHDDIVVGAAKGDAHFGQLKHLPLQITGHET